MKTNWCRSGLLAIVLAAPLAAAKPPIPAVPPQTGAWLNADRQALEEARAGLGAQTEQQGAAAPLLPVIEELKALIENDPELYMLFTQMFDQIPREVPDQEDPVGNPTVRDYREMLKLINRILTQAPEFNANGLVGFPINAILNWPMGTPAGGAAFLNDKVNGTAAAGASPVCLPLVSVCAPACSPILSRQTGHSPPGPGGSSGSPHDAQRSGSLMEPSRPTA